jgi:hypothetical protein
MKIAIAVSSSVLVVVVICYWLGWRLGEDEVRTGPGVELRLKNDLDETLGRLGFTSREVGFQILEHRFYISFPGKSSANVPRPKPWPGGVSSRVVIVDDDRK